MIPAEIDVLINIVKKITRVDAGLGYKTSTQPHEISNVFFERQGINEAIRILEGVRDGNINPKDILTPD